MSELLEHERAVAECLLASYGAAVPPAAQAVACEHLTDLLGVMLAGAQHPSTLALLGTLPAQVPAPGASARAIGQGKSLSIQHAALFNAFAAHVDDFDDDDTLLSLSHPTVTVGAACLALCDALDLSGSALVAAYLTGVETIMRLGPLVNPRHYLAGWHATCTFGVVGAAAASGLLLGLDVDRLRHALGFAASMAAGLRSNFGSDAKPLQTGLAAAHGVMAAQMAAAGMTSTPGSLMGPTGMVSMFAGVPVAVQDFITPFARPFALEGVGVTIKAYPCCTCSHAAIALLMSLIADEQLSATAIARVEVSVDPATPRILIHPQATTAMEAKFSLPFSLAIAVVQGQLALQDFNDETVQRDEVRALAQKVFTICDDTLPKGAGGVALGCRLRLTTVDGNTFFRSTDVEPGSKAWRLSHQQLADKFVRCASGSLTAAQAADVFASALDMAALPTLRSLLAALCPDARN